MVMMTMIVFCYDDGVVGGGFVIAMGGGGYCYRDRCIRGDD